VHKFHETSIVKGGIDKFAMF